MTGHTLLRHGILVRLLLLLLEIALVVQSSLWRHVGLGHRLVVGRHAGLARRHLGMVVLGRLYRVVVDAICIAARWLWGVQTSLCRVSNAMRLVGQLVAAYLDEVLALWLGD
jgi:hypothetical protein